MSDDLFDALARHQWETDGGRPCDEDASPDRPPLPHAREGIRGFRPAAVAPAAPACLSFRAANELNPEEHP